jgi:hypothetical protein
MVLGFSFVTGCCMSLASPSYLALTYDLVGREDLANAIALNSRSFNCRAWLDQRWPALRFECLGSRVVSLRTAFRSSQVVASLWMVRMERRRMHRAVRKATRDLARPDRRLRYVRNRPRVSSLLLLSAVNSLFGAPYFSLVPIYARDTLPTWRNWPGVTDGQRQARARSFAALLVAYLGDFKRRLVCSPRRDRVRHHVSWDSRCLRADVVPDVLSSGSAFSLGMLDRDPLTLSCKSLVTIRCVGG